MISFYFDKTWYTKHYPDVAAAGIDPLQHYLTFGQKEGRWPCALPALELEQQLWQAEQPEPFLQQLSVIFAKSEPLHSALAAWVLARWFGSFGQWAEVEPLLPQLLQDESALGVINHQGPFLLAFTTLLHCAKPQAAAALLSDSRWPHSTDKQLAYSMLASNKAKLAAINHLFKANTLQLLADNTDAELDKLRCIKPDFEWRRVLPSTWFFAKVSVIVPCFNASKTLATALESLLVQTHRNLQILVADDCSTDDSASIVRQFAQRDPRVTLVPLAKNSGAYVARNTALQQATGDFITTHDADDWSHPQKIALQLAALQQQPKVMASVSHWVRCSPDLAFQRWRMEDGWIYRNVSSLLFRREVFTTLGFWDCVSVNADTEYYYRIKQQFGSDSIVEVLPSVPLSFGRADEASLSQTKASHLRTQFRGLRKDYHEAALAWQRSASSLYLPAEPQQRPFVAPAMMCRGSAVSRQHNLQRLLEQKQLFDAQWYLRRYTDVAQAKVDPLSHFIEHGAAEGRDPLPTFSLSGYAYQQQLSPENVLEHWLTATTPKQNAICISGEAIDKANVPTLMLVGHAVTDRLFGAERSLLDVVKALSNTHYRLILVLPSAQAPEYITLMQRFVHKVIIMPFYWWHAQRVDEPAVLEQFAQLIKYHEVDLVYVNTLVLSEPISAAKAVNVPIVMHVRELLAHDPALCEVLGADAETVRQRLINTDSTFIANSAVVANWLAVAERCVVIPNMLEISEWPLQPLPNQAKLQVAMLSSNLPKKGLDDVINIAKRCIEQGIAADFLLFGPENEFVKHYRSAGLPDNLMFCGYAAQPQLAIAQADVVLNLSHFQESFGRSVLEAMAAGRTVIAYDWGALAELIQPDCGILVPYQDIDAVVSVLATLATDQRLRQQIGHSARQLVTSRYSVQQVSARLDAFLQQQLGR